MINIFGIPINRCSFFFKTISTKSTIWTKSWGYLLISTRFFFNHPTRLKYWFPVLTPSQLVRRTRTVATSRSCCARSWTRGVWRFFSSGKGGWGWGVIGEQDDYIIMICIDYIDYNNIHDTFSWPGDFWRMCVVFSISPYWMGGVWRVLECMGCSLEGIPGRLWEHGRLRVPIFSSRFFHRNHARKFEAIKKHQLEERPS